jgi:hypothetical protein
MQDEKKKKKKKELVLAHNFTLHDITSFIIPE